MNQNRGEEIDRYRELLELIVAQVGALTHEVGSLTREVGLNTQNIYSLTNEVGSLTHEVGLNTKNIDILTRDVTELKNGQKEIQHEVRRTSITIENDIKPKINILFDGYIQLNDKFDRIEQEVLRHEEVIIRKIK